MIVTNYIKENCGLYTVKKPLTADEFISCAKHIIAEKYHRLGKISNPGDSKDYFIGALAELKEEAFCAIFLDNAGKIINFEMLFSGTINYAKIYPRIVVKKSITYNAAGIIFGHNHPSGENATPSTADVEVTKSLAELLRQIDVKVLDHIIVSGSQAVSMAEKRLI